MVHDYPGFFRESITKAEFDHQLKQENTNNSRLYSASDDINRSGGT